MKKAINFAVVFKRLNRIEKSINLNIKESKDANEVELLKSAVANLGKLKEDLQKIKELPVVEVKVTEKVAETVKAEPRVVFAANKKAPVAPATKKAPAKPIVVKGGIPVK